MLICLSNRKRQKESKECIQNSLLFQDAIMTHDIILLVRKESNMETLATTRMSSKGQVVIPEAIRKRLDLREGAQFLVVGGEDVVILKVVTSPDINDFDALIKQARRQAKEAGLKPKEVRSAINRARGKK